MVAGARNHRNRLASRSKWTLPDHRADHRPPRRDRPPDAAAHGEHRARPSTSRGFNLKVTPGDRVGAERLAPHLPYLSIGFPNLISSNRGLLTSSRNGMPCKSWHMTCGPPLGLVLVRNFVR